MEIDRALAVGGAPFDDGGGGVGSAAGKQGVHMGLEVRHAHQHHESFRAAEGRPIDVLIGRLVASNDGEAGGDAAVGDGDAGVGGSGEGGSDAGNNLERHAPRAQVVGLFPTASEDEGVAAFQAADDMPGRALLGEDLVDFVL